MDLLLNLEDLMKHGKERDDARLKIFREVLQQCHNSIKRHSSESPDVTNMQFRIPQSIHGRPIYDPNVLRNFLVENLADNGLVATPVDPETLYISWAANDINLDRYFKRRNRICPVPPNEKFIDSLKQRQERISQLKAERTARLAAYQPPILFPKY